MSGSDYIAYRLLQYDRKPIYRQLTMRRNSKTRPLTTAGVHILVALSGGPLHGYGIIKEVERLFGQEWRIGPGTLYDNLPRLMNDGFVEEAKAAKGDSRRTYELTQAGATALSVELEQMAVVLREGRKRLRHLQEKESI